MRVLIISDAEREACHAVALFAARPENHYRPGPGAVPPGRISECCLQLGLRGDFRCVFSFTVDPTGTLWRHLSMSVPERGMLPHTAFAEEIAHLFGFKGAPAEWEIGVHEGENCWVIAQQVSP